MLGDKERSSSTLISFCTRVLRWNGDSLDKKGLYDIWWIIWDMMERIIWWRLDDPAHYVVSIIKEADLSIYAIGLLVVNSKFTQVHGRKKIILGCCSAFVTSFYWCSFVFPLVAIKQLDVTRENVSVHGFIVLYVRFLSGSFGLALVALKYIYEVQYLVCLMHKHFNVLAFEMAS